MAIATSIISILGFKIWISCEGWINLTTNSKAFHFIIGFSCMLVSKKIKQSIEYTKCLKCGETYFYNKLEDGKCPICKVDTIDIDIYYNKKG